MLLEAVVINPRLPSEACSEILVLSAYLERVHAVNITFNPDLKQILELEFTAQAKYGLLTNVYHAKRLSEMAESSSPKPRIEDRQTRTAKWGWMAMHDPLCRNSRLEYQSKANSGR
jgi:hypothetical protein